jgi:hypothetical protein
VGGTMRRLRHLREALRHAQPQAIATSAEEAQGDPGAPVLLSDEQVQRFVADGYLQIQLEDDDGISHRAIHREAWRLWQSSGEAFGAGVGNDIYPAIPQLGNVMSSPRVAGALASLLGEGYTMEPHRQMHNSTENTPPRGQQDLHKDTQRGKPPNHLPRSCFVFYFPAGCTEEMGPTELIPGSHFLSVDDQDWSVISNAPAMLGPNVISTKLTSAVHQPFAVISHQAMIHRGCARLTDEDEDMAPWRPMMKFIFSRGSECAPRWDHHPESVRPFAEFATEAALVPAMEATWDWLLDQEPHSRVAELPSQQEVDALLADLTAQNIKADEAMRVRASYSLGRFAQRGSDVALSALLDALSSPESSDAARRVAAPGLQAAGSAALCGLCETLRVSMDYRVLMYGADALGEAACRTPTLSNEVEGTLRCTVEKLKQMSAASPRLQKWAAAGGPSRSPWEFAEDTAIDSCMTALSKIAQKRE